ncbi:AAA family ATPase [Streptomyces abikoensis]
MTRSSPRLDWGWKVTPAAGAVMTAGGAYSLAAAGGLAGLPPAYALLAAGAGALAQAGADLHQRRPHGHMVTRCAAWLAAGGWSAVALAGHTVFTWASAGWWGAGTSAAVVLARALADAEETARSEHAQRRLQKWANGKAGEWEKRLSDLFRLQGHRVDGVSPWKGDVGYTVRVQMPENTPDLPATAERTLAAALRLPRGGGVQITDGMVYGEIHIHVTAKDVLAEIIDLPGGPEDTTPTSIYDGFPLGLRPDAEEARLLTVDDCALITGQIGSGKTNLVNDLNAGALRSVDTVVMHIDVTGAGISLPWLHSWALDGTAGVPLIDWTADTVEEAHILCDTLIAGIGARKAGHQDLLTEDDKIEVSADVPAVVLVVDEIAELSMALLTKIDTIVNTGRAVRVRVVICGLRATQDVITAAMKKQSRNRVGMRVSDPEELSHLFPTGGARLNPKAAPYRGCGFYAAPDAEDAVGDPSVFKAYRIKPKVIRALSIKYADRRPRLEPVFLDTEPGRYYPSRWGRILPRLYKNKKLAATTHPYTDLPVLRPPVDEVKGTPITSSAAPLTSAAPHSPAPGAADTAARPARFGKDLLAQMLDAARTTTGRREEAPADETNVIRAEFGRVLKQAGGPEDRPSPVPRLLGEAHQHLVAAGGRMHTADLATRMDMDAVTLGTELNRLMREVGVERPGKGTVRAGADGEAKAGYLAETLAAAIRAYAQRDAQ